MVATSIWDPQTSSLYVPALSMCETMLKGIQSLIKSLFYNMNNG